MSKRLQTQLKNPDELRNILKKVPIDFELDDGREVNTLLIYLPHKSGVSDHLAFFNAIKKSILVNFVLSCREVEKKLGVESDESAEELFDKALRKLSQHTAHGELGELILFTLLDVYFEAPKLLSKVSLKTSRQMPVYGADAVHGQFYNGDFRLYLGESKLHDSFGGAATKAVSSIESAKEKFDVEFDLLDSHMDFPDIDDKTEAELLNLLNPFSGVDPYDKIHSPCFIGFAEPDMIAGADSEEELQDAYIELAGKYVADFYEKAEKRGIAIEETALLMLPYACVSQLVNEFIKFLGIKK